jgi:hypothetical protein
MNRRQVNVMLRHRDIAGKLDGDALHLAQQERERKEEGPIDPYAELRMIRRLQAWPEHMIDKMIRTLEIANG